MTHDERIANIAEEIYHIVDPWDREYQEPDEIAKQIKNDPLAVIEFLLNELQDYIMSEV